MALGYYVEIRMRFYVPQRKQAQFCDLNGRLMVFVRLLKIVVCLILHLRGLSLLGKIEEYVG